MGQTSSIHFDTLSPKEAGRRNPLDFCQRSLFNCSSLPTTRLLYCILIWLRTPLTHTAHCQDNCVSLDDAALHLMQKDQTAKSSGKLPLEKICMSSGAFKSRVRRLYDIANVLMALGLIEKMFLPSSRKPAFRWVSLLRLSNTNASVTDLALTKSNEKNTGRFPQKRHRPQSIGLLCLCLRSAFVEVRYLRSRG